jgi:hypothetical protein
VRGYGAAGPRGNVASPARAFTLVAFMSGGTNKRQDWYGLAKHP